jgi:hypothetical protein
MVNVGYKIWRRNYADGRVKLVYTVSRGGDGNPIEKDNLVEIVDECLRSKGIDPGKEDTSGRRLDDHDWIATIDSPERKPGQYTDVPLNYTDLERFETIFFERQQKQATSLP